MRKLLLLLVCTLVSIGTWADISIYKRTQNGVEGYGVYGFQPGELAALLSGNYTGTINSGSTGTVEQLKSAAFVKIGSTNEVLKQEDLEALSALTNVQYLRMDNCTTTGAIDCSTIGAGSSALLEVTMPAGLTREQVEAANAKFKTVASGVKLVVGVSGEVETEQRPHHWYTLNGQTYEYTGTVAEGQTQVQVSGLEIWADLTPVEGYPKYSYSFKGRTYETSEKRIINYYSADHFVPEYLEVELTENNGSFTYQFMNGGWEPTLNYTGGNQYQKDGKWYALIYNDPPTNGYAFDNYGTVYKYTYIDKDGKEATYDQYDDDGKILIDTYTGTLDLTTTYETVNNFVIDGATACVNVAGSLPDALNLFTDNNGDNTLTDYKSAKNVTIVGQMNNSDISSLSNFNSRELVDLSDAEFVSGAKGEDVINTLIDQCSGNTDPLRNVALVLPTNNDAAGTAAEAGTVNQHEVWYNLKGGQNSAAYKNLACIAYFADADKKDLRVYGTDATVGKLAPVVKSGETSITFEYAYAADPANGMAGALPANNSGIYPQATSTFLSEGVSALPAVNVNFNVMNISNLGLDFSSLNSETHYIVIPTNTTTSKESETVTHYPGFDDETRYTYPNSVYVVATYKDIVVPYSDNCSYDDFKYVATEPTTITYVRPVYGTGHLSGAADYIPMYMKTASRMNVIGVLNSDDVATLGDVHATTVDLVRAHISETDLASYSSDYVEYLGLPDGTAGAMGVTSPNDFAFKTSCPMLKALGAYDPTTKTYTIHSTERTVTYGEGVDDHNNPIVASQENSIYKITNMCAPNTTRAAGMANGMENLVASGYLTLDDIHMNGGVVTGTTTNDQGQTTDIKSGQAGLESNNSGTIKTADFENAVFLDNSHMNFMGGLKEDTGIGVGACWANILEQMILPTDPRVYTIPRGALNNCKSLTEICIPYNFEHICDGVFDNGRLDHITTTDANGALIDKGDHTFTFSANLKELGEKPAGAMQKVSAQVFPHNTVVYDVYCLATTTPKCYRDVFPANMLAGWGSFNNKIYSREKYMGDPDSEDGSGTYTMLRFPSVESYTTEAAYNDNAKLYTDVNKIYTKKDQTGAVDANGEAPLWPTQREAYRTFAQASLGLTWNEWQTGYDINLSVNGPDGKLTGAGGSYSLSDVSTDLTTSINQNDYNYLGSIHPADSEGDYPFTDYEGWHQFVLSMANYVEPTEVVVNEKIVREYEEAGWFTFCIPYNMSYSQVVELLGVPKSTDKVTNKLNGQVVENEDIMPDIHQLISVIRHKSTGPKDNNKVTFRISGNLYDKDRGVTQYLTFDHTALNPASYSDASQFGINTTNDYCCLVGGQPYYIKAYKRVGEDIPGQNLGKVIVTRYGNMFSEASSCVHNGINYYEQLGTGDLETLQFAKPYELHQVQAMNDANPAKKLTYKDDEGNEHKYFYSMIGQFNDQYLPKYCVYLAKDPNTGKNKWYRYTGKNGNYTWAAYKCVILATTEDADGKGGKYRAEAGEGPTYSYYPEVKKIGTSSDYVEEPPVIRFADGRDDDDFENFTESKYIFAFDDEGITEFDENGEMVTAIDRLDGEDLTIDASNCKVYNMSGQYVGSSLNGLSRGMYIVNGKKFVVK